MAAEGAYRKAAASMTSELLHMSNDEDLSWATELLPRSVHPDNAVFNGSSPGAQPDAFDAQPVPQQLENDTDPLAGVRYGKLVGPGPTGFRPEHLKEMLAVPRLREALSLQKALNRLHYTMLRGELADSMRWLTRTRLCWQKNKNGKPRPIKMEEILRSSYAKRFTKNRISTIRNKN